MELQSRLADFDRANTRVFAISYDPVPVLARFAEQQGITYELLSDVGSVAITRLGLLNEHIVAMQAASGRPAQAHHTGVPYPGVFVLDEHGVVMDKRFEQTHQPRPAPALLLEELMPQEELTVAASARAQGTGVQAVAWVGAATYRAMQRLHLHVTLQIAPELHIYGTPAPEGFTPLQITAEPLEGLMLEPADLPDPQPFRVAGVDEPCVVHEGTVSTTLPLQMASNLGEIELEVVVRYQACSATVCYPPETLNMTLTLQGLDNLRPEPQGT